MARPKDRDLERLWRQRFQRHLTGGLSVTVFCAREGVSSATFYYWKRRLAAAPAPISRPSPLFVPVRVPEPSHDPEPSSTRGVVLELPHGIRLKLNDRPEPEWLGRLVAGMAGLPDREPTS